MKGTAGRRILIGTAVLVALALIGAGGAVAAGLLRPPTPDYRIAEVTRGDVSEVVDLTGSVTRVNQAEVTFPTSGTVTWVGVEVGEKVTKGQSLARIEKLPLQVELVKAQSELTQARAAYQQDLKAAEDAAKRATASPSSSPTSTAEPTDPTEPGTEPPPSSPGGGGGGGAAAALPQVMSRLGTDLDTATKRCAPASPTPSASPTITEMSPSPTSISPTPATSPSPSSPSPSASPTPSATPTPPLGVPADVQACLNALAAVTGTQMVAAKLLAAGQVELATATAQLSAAAEAQAQAMAEAAQQQAEAMAEAQAQMLAEVTGAEDSAGPSGSMRAQLAKDLVAITRAQQAVDKAEDDLAGATLKAPITGIVGSVDVTEGGVASTDTGITVVGSGASEVTVRVPLALMGKVTVGQAAEPPGGTKPVRGEVTSVSLLPSSSSGGDTSYDTVISVRRSPVALTTGVTATVRIVVAAATDVLVLPMSATIPIDENRATVRVLRAGSLEEVTVTTGVKGVTRIEVVEGLTAGQEVVLADPTRPLPRLDLFGTGAEEPGEQSGEEPTADSESEPPSPEPTR